MYCQFCGREIPDGSVFCNYCGERVGLAGSLSKESKDAGKSMAAAQKAQISLAPEDAPSHRILQRVREAFAFESTAGIYRIVLGFVLVAAALIFLLSNPHDGGYFARLRLNLPEEIAAVSHVASVLLYADVVIMDGAAMVSLIAGISLLQKQSGAATIAKTSAVFYLVSLCYFFFAKLCVSYYPQFLLKINNPGYDENWPDALKSAIGKESNLFSYRDKTAVFSAVIAAICCVLIFVLLALYRRACGTADEKPVLWQKTDRGTEALVVMIVPILVFWAFTVIVDRSFIGLLFSENESGAHSLAVMAIGPGMHTFSVTAVFSVFFLAWLYIIPGMCLKKARYAILFVISALLIAAAGAVVFVFSANILKNWSVPMEIMSPAVRLMHSEAFALSLLFSALALWIYSAARGYIPFWLQAVLCVAIFVVYFASTVFLQFRVLHMTSFPVGMVCTAVFIGLVSVLAAVVAGKKRKAQQM